MKLKMIIVTILLGLVLAGCSKLTQENYDRVKVGMDFSEVVEIIGQPDQCDAALGTKSCTWGSEKKYINIKFVADKVAIPTMKGL